MANESRKLTKDEQDSAISKKRTTQQLQQDNRVVNTAIIKGWKPTGIMPEPKEGSGYHPSVVKDAGNFLKKKK